MKYNLQSNSVNIILADFDNARLMDLFSRLQNSNPMIKIVAICQNGKDLIDRASTMNVDAVLMDYNLLDLTAIQVADKLRELSPTTDIFAISDVMSAEFIFNAKHKGITELFQRENLVARDIADRIVNHVIDKQKEYERLASEHGAIEKGTKNTKIVNKYITKTISQSVILTYNTKGGVGKSTVASNLAVALKTSPFFSGKRIALVDFDCGGANVGTLFSIPDTDTLHKNIAMWENIDPALTTPDEVDSLLIQGSHGIMVATAPLVFAVAKSVTYDISETVLKTLKRFFDVIIIDGGPNISPSIDCALEHATHILLIANPEGQSIKQLARITTYFEEVTNNSDRDMTYLLNKMFVVLNHAQKPSKWDLKANEVARAINRPLLREIPNSEIVKEALHGNSRKQAVELKPDDDFSIAIRKLANDLVGAYPEGIEDKNFEMQTSKKEKKKRFSLFSKKIK